MPEDNIELDKTENYNETSKECESLYTNSNSSGKKI